MNVKFHKITSYTWNFQNFTCVFTILVKFDIHFLRVPWEIFFGVITDDWLHLKPLKNVKRNAIFFKLFPVQGFCPLKIKITQFPGGFRLNYFFDHNHTCGLLNISALHIQYGIQAFAKFKRPECTRLHQRISISKIFLEEHAPETP